jgi:hypothetical protein
LFLPGTVLSSPREVKEAWPGCIWGGEEGRGEMSVFLQ